MHNTARQIVSPNTQQTRKVTKRRVIKASYHQKERKLMMICISWIACMGLLVILSSVRLAKVQHTYQQATDQLTSLTTRNNNLKQEISGLTSQDRLNKIANSNGLSLHEKSIRNVSR